MELEFVLGDGDNGIAGHGLAKIIGMAGMTEAQFAAGDDAVPSRDDEAVAGNVLEKNQWV